MCDMCLDYEIFDIQLWNSVLQQLLTFSMVSDLEKPTRLLALLDLYKELLPACTI